MAISEKLRLDEIDKAIIALLQDNPNLTHTEISQKIDRSQPTVGMRIKKLEKKGILHIQPGINFKKVEIFLAILNIKTNHPSELLNMAEYCPFMLNAFRVSGDYNVCVLLSSSQLDKLDRIVNYHFRNNPNVQNVTMELITEIAKDFIMPIDFDSEENDPTIEDGCSEKCKYRMAVTKGLVQEPEMTFFQNIKQ